MTRLQEKDKTVIDRLGLVALYLGTGMTVTVFARRYNAGTISRRRLGETGPLDAEDLDRWTDICMGVAEDD